MRGKIETYKKKINLNSDKKQLWDSDLKSLQDGKMCDFVAIPVDRIGNLIGKEEEDCFFSTKNILLENS